MEIVIEKKQTVHDIVKEVVEAHDEFSQDYDTIGRFFPVGNYKKLFNFCKANIVYSVEPEDDQTTRSPAATLTIGEGDCKHYAGFIGGIIDAWNRNQGAKIKWCYRFASYDVTIDEPGHVFVVVFENGNELWIDPVLDYLDQRSPAPYYELDKKIKMLRRLSGIDEISTDPYILDNALTAPHRVSGPFGIANYSVSGPGGQGNPYFAGIPWLGLTSYVEDTGEALSRAINWQIIANQINEAVKTGPDPGHVYDADFVKWIYDNNIKGWNFYYWGGVKPGYDASDLLAKLNPAYPHAIVTPDGRLTFDRTGKIDDYKTNEIHALWASVQNLINFYDTESPFPMKPAVLKGFSQGKFGGVEGGDLFVEVRGSSIFKQVGKAIEDGVNFIKDVGLKIAGSIPRNAFLGLVGINAFNMAHNMWEDIQAGKWDAMAKKWRSVGGNPDKLYNTIEDGQHKPAILGAAIIGEAATGTAALLAAAAPIIAVMLQFLNKDGKLNGVINATSTILKDKFGIDLTAYGITQNGKPVSIIVDPADDENKGGGNDDMPTTNFMEILTKNPIVSGIAAAGIAYLFARRSKNKLLITGAAGVGAYLLASKAGSGSRNDKIKAISDSLTNDPGKDVVVSALEKMSDSEIDVVYKAFVNYLMKGGSVYDIQKSDPALYDKIVAILTKYNLQGT